MNSAYLAISYICNQKCSFCPCTKEEKKFKYMDFQEVKDSVFRLKEELGIMEVVLSGGEPTLHPNFFDIISYLDSMNIKITLLSNAEKLDDINFVREISNRINSNNISVITTIHSQTEELHERVNGSKGSFRKTIRGLVNVNQAGFHTIVKHCVTKENYTELKEFFQFVDNTFPQSVDMQLCSIDYCGLEEEIKNNYKLEFPRMRPYLEKMFDKYLEKGEPGRLVYCFNMPLCSADSFYWRFFTPKSYGYEGYVSPNRDGKSQRAYNVDSNVGLYTNACKKCKANQLCAGTYRTAFELFGDSIVKPYV